MTPLQEALEAVRARCRALPAEDVPLLEGQGRVLAGPVRARRDQPATDISMMDGYALHSSGGAALTVVGEVAAGDAPWTRSLGAGEAARIFTGAPVPPGADCVVMQEHAVRQGSSLRLQQAAKPGQHIRRRGEELTAGGEALEAGTLLASAELALAAACGASTIRVHRRPRVALLCTGSELVPVGTEDPPPGKLIETNSIALAALCLEAGATVERLGIAPDDVATIAGRLKPVQADILLTTGGASVGDHDHAQEALERLSGSLVFHTVAIRPGKPVLFGIAGDRLVFGLPGNPAAATLGFELFVRLAIRLLAGDPNPARPQARARLRGKVSRIPGLTFFPRGRVTAEGSTLYFSPGAQQSSMQIASWAAVNAVAVIPPGDGRLDDGEELDVLLVGPLSA